MAKAASGETGVPQIDVMAPEQTTAPSGSEQLKQIAAPGWPTRVVPGQGRVKSKDEPQIGSAFDKALNDATGGSKARKPKAAKDDVLPAGAEDPSDHPALEDDTDTEAQAAADRSADRETATQRLARLKNRDNARPAKPEPKKPAADETEGDDPDTEAPKTDTEPPETDTDDAEGETTPTLTAAQKQALVAHARRFGLQNLPLDLVATARDSHIDQFDEIVGQANGLPPGGQPAGPAAGQVQQGGQPPQASGPMQTPARTPASGLPPTLDDAQLSAATDAFGPEFKPFADAFRGQQQTIQHLLQQQQETNSWREHQVKVQNERLQQEGAKKLNDFFGNKARAGFADLIGSQARGLTDAQKQVRMTVATKAVAYINGMRAKGIPVEPDEALELGWGSVSREQDRANALREGRQQIQSQVVNRHRATSLPGGAGLRNGTKNGMSATLDQKMGQFLNSNRRN